MGEEEEEGEGEEVEKEVENEFEEEKEEEEEFPSSIVSFFVLLCSIRRNVAPTHRQAT